MSLTSKSAIRYIGTLSSIDTKASTVALKDVCSFGTEGRPRDGGPVMPSECIYPYIIFRASDILDLQVIAKPTAPTEVAPPIVPALPHIHSSSSAFPLAGIPTVSTTGEKPLKPQPPFSLATPLFPPTSLNASSNPLSVPPSQLSPNTWAYDNFGSYGYSTNDLGSTTNNASSSIPLLPKPAKFSSLYVPVSNAGLGSYGTDNRRKDTALKTVKGPVELSSSSTSSAFELPLSTGLHDFTPLPHGVANDNIPPEAATSGALSPFDEMGDLEKDWEKTVKIATNQETLQRTGSEEVITQNGKALTKTSTDNSLKITPEKMKAEDPKNAIESVKAPVPRAWGPPPMASGQVLAAESDGGISRTNKERSFKQTASSEQDDTNSSTRAPGSAPRASRFRQDAQFDRIRRGARRGRGAIRTRGRDGKLIEVPDEDFDFEEMHEKLAAIEQTANEYPPVDLRYDKSKSFFDNLVSEKDSRAETSMSQQRAKDRETFGEAGGRSHVRRRGGGRGTLVAPRGKPTRARARGRGR